MARARWNKPRAERTWEGKYTVNPTEQVQTRPVPYGQDCTYGDTSGPRARAAQSEAVTRDGGGPTQSASARMWEIYEAHRQRERDREAAQAKAKENARIEAERVRIARLNEDARRKELLAEEEAKRQAVLAKQVAFRAQLLVEAIPFQELPTA